jgi:hypothetical protein
MIMKTTEQKSRVAKIHLSIGHGGNLEIWDTLKEEIFGLVQLKDILAMVFGIPYGGFKKAPWKICIYHPFQDDNEGTPQEVGTLEWCPKKNNVFVIELGEGDHYSFPSEKFADLICTKVARKYFVSAKAVHCDDL